MTDTDICNMALSNIGKGVIENMEEGVENARACKLGSPPHVRERPRLFLQSLLILGITPACAGKTRLMVVSKSGSRDHPRMCGKDESIPIVTNRQQGSPPHVRERRLCCQMLPALSGITPACAGKTSSSHG